MKNKSKKPCPGHTQSKHIKIPKDGPQTSVFFQTARLFQCVAKVESHWKETALLFRAPSPAFSHWWWYVANQPAGIGLMEQAIRKSWQLGKVFREFVETYKLMSLFRGVSLQAHSMIAPKRKGKQGLTLGRPTLVKMTSLPKDPGYSRPVSHAVPLPPGAQEGPWHPRTLPCFPGVRKWQSFILQKLICPWKESYEPVHT